MIQAQVRPAPTSPCARWRSTRRRRSRRRSPPAQQPVGRMARRDGPAVGDARAALSRGRLRRPALPRLLPRRDARARARAAAHRQPAGAAGSGRRRRRGAARDPLAVRLDADAAAAAVVARRRGSARRRARARRRRAAADDVSRLAVLPIDARPDRDGARQGRRRHRRRVRSAARAGGPAGRSARRSARGWSGRSPASSTSRATASCSIDNPVLRRSIDVRNPYVDPINLVQVELLRRLRAPATRRPTRPPGCAARCSSRSTASRRGCGTRADDAAASRTYANTSYLPKPTRSVTPTVRGSPGCPT